MTTPPGRNAILEAVRTSLARADQTVPVESLPPTPAPAVSGDLAAAFTAALESVAGRVVAVADLSAAAREIERIAAAGVRRRIAFSDAALLAEVAQSLPAELICEPADTAELLACEIGVTTAQAAIAETGTLVLASDAERHRLLSLLPPVHIAVVPRDRIVATLNDAITAGAAPPAALTLITGPSRTADIELELVLGVHGPVELHVLILGGAPRPPTA